MERYLVEVEQHGTVSRGYRDADCTADAANQAFRGLRSDFRIEVGRTGSSHSFGPYESFVGRAGRYIAIVRVYVAKAGAQ